MNPSLTGGAVPRSAASRCLSRCPWVSAVSTPASSVLGVGRAGELVMGTVGGLSLPAQPRHTPSPASPAGAGGE